MRRAAVRPERPSSRRLPDRRAGRDRARGRHPRHGAATPRFIDSSATRSACRNSMRRRRADVQPRPLAAVATAGRRPGAGRAGGAAADPRRDVRRRPRRDRARSSRPCRSSIPTAAGCSRRTTWPSAAWCGRGRRSDAHERLRYVHPSGELSVRGRTVRTTVDRFPPLASDEEALFFLVRIGGGALSHVAAAAADGAARRHPRLRSAPGRRRPHESQPPASAAREAVRAAADAVCRPAPVDRHWSALATRGSSDGRLPPFSGPPPP